MNKSKEENIIEKLTKNDNKLGLSESEIILICNSLILNKNRTEGCDKCKSNRISNRKDNTILWITHDNEITETRTFSDVQFCKDCGFEYDNKPVIQEGFVGLRHEAFMIELLGAFNNKDEEK